MKPVIGVTCFCRDTVYGNWHRHAAILPSAYISMIERAGGAPLIIPPAGDMTQILDLIDGLVVSGGPDLCPSSYGEEPGTMTVEFYPDQDETEMGLIREAISRDMPFLGVCRGMQILSVMHGGRLHQHLDTTPGHEDHGGYDGVETEHGVSVTEGSLLARLMGTSIKANSTHHQGVADAGDLEVTGTADHDGLIEAVERPDRKFCLGVQWHPERAGHDVLYSGLVEAARG
ncbi:MAG: gamma-glutamyl-gamma-aminobutyrate hydrolase family protein [Candidatus Thermoplasmatota archaeon]|nr:gamma-glutamyl-gamma-aminobutyrate hydrolase family protein [Candidatus Thermoplasmatota archaeon]|tara:strand:- start:4440 stop:5129 length:690 start_codon:yes stop_codon:yes gene_type:complete